MDGTLIHYDLLTLPFSLSAAVVSLSLCENPLGLFSNYR